MHVTVSPLPYVRGYDRVMAAKAIAIVSALVAAGCVAARYPPIAGALPAIVALAAFAAAGFAIGATAAAEARLPRGTVGPLWMRVATPARLALALGLSFCTTAIAQVLEISLGPVDPTFPSAAPAGTNALWFFVFTIGFAGIGMMSAPGVFLPVLHPIARALKKAPLVVAVIVMGGVLAAIGIAFAIALGLPAVATLVAQGKAWVDANATIVTVVMLALTVGPALLPSRGDE